MKRWRRGKSLPQGSQPSKCAEHRRSCCCFAVAALALLLLASLRVAIPPHALSRASMASAAMPPPSRSFQVGGHRGMGQNRPPADGASPSSAFRPGIRENTVASLSRAAEAGADFVEMDVQVTKDGTPVLFHDNLIWTEPEAADGALRKEVGRRIPDLTLEEFMAINERIPLGKLLRQGPHGSFYPWREAEEAPLPTLAQALAHVPPSLAFNLELKFPADDSVDITDADVSHMLDHVLPLVKEWQLKTQRRIFFSSFMPQAVLELRKRDPSAQVYFLTVGRRALFADERMNSVDAAIRWSIESTLSGVC